jgi:hypothetical protein
VPVDSIFIVLDVAGQFACGRFAAITAEHLCLSATQLKHDMICIFFTITWQRAVLQQDICRPLLGVPLQNAGVKFALIKTFDFRMC